MSDIVKVCKVHGELKLIETYLQYSKHKEKKYSYYQCRQCVSLKKKRLYDLNPRKHIEHSLKTRAKYRDKILIRDKEWKIKQIMPLEKYNNLLIKQNNLCAICKKKQSGNKRLSIDHCHKTLKIRGLLCHYCNTALGSFKDSIELLQSAIDYLKASK